MEDEKIVQASFGLATAVPVGLGMYLTYTMSSISTDSLIMFSLVAALYAAMIYTLYEVTRVRKRLYNITEEKDSETEEVEDESDRESE